MEARTQRTRTRVLLADDHGVLRDSLKLLLEREPEIEVVAQASDGREAVRLARKLVPDVAVLDVVMPGLNGIEVVRRIRDRVPHTQVVILSTHASSEHIHQALTAGALGYVPKQATGQDVVDAVRSVRLGRRFLSSAITEEARADLDAPRGRRRKSPLERLTPREREVLQLVVEGRTSKQIAGVLELSPKTVETYRHRTMHKLNLRDLPSLVRFAMEQGLTA